VRFASKREANRYSELKLLQKAGVLDSLVLQQSFPLEVNGVLIGRYVADFHYFDCEKKEVVTEDAKGVKTPVYKLKKKLMKALYGIEIREV
jgi:hypothetical protein